MNWRDELRNCCAGNDLAGAQKAAAALLEDEPGTAVSYTHLTLPPIYSV